jgi:hypothetical protein
MSKNILIYSDGTGQAGGLFVDENRMSISSIARTAARPRTRRRCTLEIIINPKNGPSNFQNQVVRKLAQRAIRSGSCRLSWTARERVSGVTHT